MRIAARRNARLRIGKQVLHRVHLLAQRVERRIERALPVLEAVELRALVPKRLLALDDALVRVLIAADA